MQAVRWELCRGRHRRSGNGSAAGDAGGDVDGDEAFAEAGVADEEGDFAERDFFGPEPLDGLAGVVDGGAEAEVFGFIFVGGVIFGGLVVGISVRGGFSGFGEGLEGGVEGGGAGGF